MSAEHGTRSFYVYHQCGCEACTQANRKYQRRYMREVYYQRHARAILERKRAARIMASVFREDSLPDGAK